MSAPPYMPLYVGDYIADTHQLSTFEHGCYLLLLMAMWRAGGSLPSDPAKLASYTHTTLNHWNRAAQMVLPLFTLEGEILTHNRITSELRRYSDIGKVRSLSGAAGGRAKSRKYNGSSVANGWQTAGKNLHNQNQGSKTLAPTERESLTTSGERYSSQPSDGQTSPVRLVVDEEFMARQMARLEALEKEDADGTA